MRKSWSWTISLDQKYAQELRTYTTMETSAVRGTTSFAHTQHAQEQIQKNEETWTGKVQTGCRGTKQGKVSAEGDGGRKDRQGNGLDEIHKHIAVVAKVINFSTRAMRQNAEHTILDEVMNLERLGPWAKD